MNLGGEFSIPIPGEIWVPIDENDLELYDLVADPDETTNLAHDFERNRDLIATMNAKLNALIAREIGVDDGSFLPLTNWITWKGARPEMINL